MKPQKEEEIVEFNPTFDLLIEHGVLKEEKSKLVSMMERIYGILNDRLEEDETDEIFTQISLHEIIELLNKVK